MLFVGGERGLNVECDLISFKEDSTIINFNLHLIRLFGNLVHVWQQRILTKGCIAGADFSRREKFNVTPARRKPTRRIASP